MTFGVDYEAKFGRDQKIIKNKLAYADKCTSYPEDCQELAIAYVMDEFLEKQKATEEKYRKHTLPGWDKDFNKINAQIVWSDIEWMPVEEEYNHVQEETEKNRKRD